MNPRNNNNELQRCFFLQLVKMKLFFLKMNKFSFFGKSLQHCNPKFTLFFCAVLNVLKLFIPPYFLQDGTATAWTFLKSSCRCVCIEHAIFTLLLQAWLLVSSFFQHISAHLSLSLLLRWATPACFVSFSGIPFMFESICENAALERIQRYTDWGGKIQSVNGAWQKGSGILCLSAALHSSLLVIVIHFVINVPAASFHFPHICFPTIKLHFEENKYNMILYILSSISPGEKVPTHRAKPTSCLVSHPFLCPFRLERDRVNPPLIDKSK